MRRHDFLRGLHRVVAPRNYLEIGLGYGRGLTCSTVRTIGVDPAPKINVDITCEHRIEQITSDAFFARPDAIAWFEQDTVDLTFIDGMHLAEFALRDFINSERLSSTGSVIVLDDMLPRTVTEAARDRVSVAWAGDVFKVAPVLETYRPDLVVLAVDTKPTGMVIVIGLDPDSNILLEHVEHIAEELVTPDPQSVPDEILHRRRAADPVRVLDSPVWRDLAAARTAGAPPSETLRSLLELAGTAVYDDRPRPPKPWPIKPAPTKKPAESSTETRRGLLGTFGRTVQRRRP